MRWRTSGGEGPRFLPPPANAGRPPRGCCHAALGVLPSRSKAFVLKRFLHRAGAWSGSLHRAGA
eukprot:4592271-Prorocentrum_lima.AAC.1